MPSLDFVYDLVEKFDEEKLDYLVITMREGREEDKVDAFFSIQPDSENTFYASIEEIKNILKDRTGNNVKKKPKKKRRKKGE
tara:strand:+ start:302 stop:547 length:246 start_codon:yes stop_codon:yes gene_type:complete